MNTEIDEILNICYIEYMLIFRTVGQIRLNAPHYELCVHLAYPIIGRAKSKIIAAKPFETE